VAVSKSVIVCENAYQATTGSDAIVIVTEWDEFKYLNYHKVFENMKKPAFLFDGRLILDHKKLKEIGYKVQAIGKTV
jgi:UDPglucose 6-dehydrogenase